MAKAHSSAETLTEVSTETHLKWLRDMQLIREFENRTMQAYQQAKIGGFCHIYSGQEACAVGTIAATKQDDPVVTAYRDHGHALARGMSARACMAEMFGKITGCAKGKGGSMHMFDRPNWLFGGHGIVGAQTPLGAGLAFASKYENEVLKKGVHPDHKPKQKITLCYLGDGAIDQGAFHEALNLASLFDLPVIFIIENNGYSMGTAIHRHTANHENLVARGESYGIDSIKIDGLDIRHLYSEFKPFADRCRENSRPGFVDLKTYRYQGHSMSDPQKYRTKDEVEEYKNKDSIARLLNQLMEEGSMTEDSWKTMQNEIRDEVLDAVEFAESSPAPEVEAELFTDVYALPQKNLSPTAEYHHGARNPLL
ncbi:MAG: pyruvate dehydrogenase (acetyl-transferring) E1 component subunit alpha [Planctomycetes bacterium]|nr:pyruvate dehydrogenase (acetyl-transferring) E1 component subunit alpha [Planctomycetota bacterium]